jgi:hypothetical protein
MPFTVQNLFVTHADFADFQMALVRIDDYSVLKYMAKIYVRGLSGKYPAILNIARTGRVALM